MDVVLGISIFTHLSEKLHFDWINELYRILKPNGIMYLTTQGANFTSKLTEVELKKINSGQLIVRGQVKEGHRTYSAFQPKSYMLNLLENMEILEHIEEEITSSEYLPQDIWIVRKK